MRSRLWFALVLAVVLFAASCGSDDDLAGLPAQVPTAGDPGVAEGPDGVEGTVLVFGAASLTDAFAEVAAAFEAANPDAEVRLNVAGSSSLREQILEGAPADVFASANQSNMAKVVEAGDVDGAPADFARNLLQIAVPAGNPGGVDGLDDFADTALLIGLCAEGVPCGDFAREALANAGIDVSVDTDEPDVRALLTKIGADELDAGIVYATDVIAAGDLVEGIDIPAEVNVEATYPIAEMTGAPNPAGAAAFIAFVLSDQGQAILARHGFIGE